MTKNLALIGTMLLFLTTCAAVTAQPALTTNLPHPLTEPNVLWIQKYPFIAHDDASYVAQTNDGGYIITGTTNNGVCPNGDSLMLIKTDANGNVSWKNGYGFEGMHPNGQVVKQTPDGCYIVVGRVGYTYCYDALVMKVDANGDVLWQKTYGDPNYYDDGKDIIQTSDGGFIILGSTNSYANGQNEQNAWLIKITADGTEQWNHTYGGSNPDTPVSFAATSDGGYILVGDTYSYSSDGGENVWILKVDGTGQEVWNVTYGAEYCSAYAYCIKAESDGFVVLANKDDQNGTGSLWLLRITNEGTLTWDHVISETGSLTGSSITPTSDGYFITATYYDPAQPASDLYLLKTDMLGNTQWLKILDLSNNLTDIAAWGIQSNDYGYIAVGSTGRTGMMGTNTSAFLLKIGSDRTLTIDSVTGGLGVKVQLKNYGQQDISNLNVTLQVTGGLLNHVNLTLTKHISVPAGGDATLSFRPFLGLGPIEILVTAGSIPRTSKGVQLLLWTSIPDAS